MAENSKIEWCDHTVNFWWGCTKVSPGCLNCYAEKQDAHFHPHLAPKDRFQGERALSSHWGPNAPRMLRAQAGASEAIRFERQAVAQGRRFRVFTNSMADFFEDRRDLDGARVIALETMFLTPHLDWLILTKRPESILALLKRAEQNTDSTGCSDFIRRWLGWGEERPKPPANVWLGTTAEDQERAMQRTWDIIKVPASVRFLSCEPLLGPIDLHLEDFWTGYTKLKERLNWVICGGESGPGARPMHPNWARGLRDQCEASGVPFLFKQWGEYFPLGPEDPRFNQNRPMTLPDFPGPEKLRLVRVGKKTAGRLLDGVEHLAYPEVSHG